LGGAFLVAKDRSLEDVIKRLGPIDSHINDIIRNTGKAYVFEAGCGHGLPMHQLKMMFGSKLHIVGMNRKPGDGDSFKVLKDAVAQGIFAEKEVVRLACDAQLPGYVHGDAGQKIPFPDNRFDLVYSICAVPFIKDKIHFLEEVNRVLCPEGTARIDFQIREDEQGEYGDFLKIVGRNMSEIPFEEYIKKYESLRFAVAPSGKKYLEMRKAGKLELGLELVGAEDMSGFGKDFFGVKSRYRVR
jgi:SAM-dependent methyltransferase